jgi:hypothetical protein
MDKYLDCKLNKKILTLRKEKLKHGILNKMINLLNYTNNILKNGVL